MAKGKVLNTTVHFTDPDTGKAEVWEPGRRLSAADRKRLGWPDDHESMVDAEDDDPEPESKMVDAEDDDPEPESKPDDDQALRKAAKDLEQTQHRGSAR